MDSFYSVHELQKLGFKYVGKNVLLSKKASIYSTETISIGDNVRIDDFVILSGQIVIGSNIHISAFVAIYGSMGVVLEDYSGISPRSTIFSAMDDFSGEYLIGPIHPISTTNVNGGLVRICKFVQIGANTIVFPNLTINEGAVVGAMSIVKRTIPEWEIHAGIPCRKIKMRSRNLKKMTYDNP